MNNYPKYFINEEQLEEALSRPTPALLKMMKEILFYSVLRVKWVFLWLEWLGVLVKKQVLKKE